MTVRFSACECQCGAIMPPAGAMRRMTKGPGLPGSPYSTAIFMFFGKTGGAGPHLTSFVFIMTAPDDASAADAKAGVISRTTGVTSAAIRCMDFMGDLPIFDKRRDSDPAAGFLQRSPGGVDSKKQRISRGERAMAPA